LGQVTELVDRFAAGCEIGLVEGAGGLLVPLAGRATFADLAAACGLAVLVVVGNRLGCVNHAALTMRWAQTAGLDVAGYIVNMLQPAPDLPMATNVELLQETLGPSLGLFPWVGEVACTEEERGRLADIAERSLQLDVFL
jgi:dethiobiotin synthetase